MANALWRLLVGAAAAGAACVAYGVFIEREAFVLRRVTVPVLPPGQAPLRILHISDLHLTGDRRRLVGWVDQLADLEPDLVVDTGDNTGSAHCLGVLREALGRLLTIPGVFVMGSNDLYAPRLINPLSYVGIGPTVETERVELPTHELRELLESGGWLDVEGVRTTLDIAGRSVEIRGTKDAHIDLDRYTLVAGQPAPDVDLSLFVTHAPYLRLLDAATHDGVDFMIAGHTHGGQVCVPGVGALTTNCDLPKDRVKGLSRHQVGGRSSWLHVSAGLGTSPTAPFRFACRPEATLLTLVGRNVS